MAVRNWAMTFAILAALGCSKKDSNNSDTPTTGGEIDNVLANAYPGSLAISVFPTNSDDGKLVEDDTGDMTIKDKVDLNKKILSGDVTDCIDIDLFKSQKSATEVTCYEFDSDMNPSKFSGQTQTYGTVDGTNGEGEACMVTFAREEVKAAVSRVDKALALVTGLLCQAKKENAASDLPAEGKDLNLADSFAKALGDSMSVETATLARLADIDGHPVYRTDIVVNDPNDNPMEVHLVHSPTSDTADKGTLWFKSKPVAGAGDINNTANKFDLMSINYSRTTEDGQQRVQFEVRQAMIEKSHDLFTSEGLVNYGGVPDDAENDLIHAIKYVAFDINPESSEGDLSYWMNPGGRIEESARGFLFNVSDNEGRLEGCGVSGATNSVSIRKAVTDPDADDILAPTRYWHPREDQNIHADKDSRYSANEGNSITKQCFKQNDDGIYEIDTSKTTHDRGYDVLAKANAKVDPPEVPSDKLEGDFEK
jgi:hypothetical protein